MSQDDNFQKQYEYVKNINPSIRMKSIVYIKLVSIIIGYKMTFETTLMTYAANYVDFVF